MRKVYFLIGALLLLTLWACQPSNIPDPDPKAVTLTFNAASSINWTLENVQGATDVGTVGAEDPSLTLTVGTRYTIINKTGLAHLFQLLNGFTVLLSENGGGSFENEAAVKFVKNADGFSFTLTQDLASVLDKYNCAFHLDMSSTITTKPAP